MLGSFIFFLLEGCWNEGDTKGKQLSDFWLVHREPGVLDGHERTVFCCLAYREATIGKGHWIMFMVVLILLGMTRDQ